MKGYLIIGFLLISCFLFGQQHFVVQSIHSLNTSYAQVDTQRNLLITYGYSDKTLKFWDSESGLLLRTIDLEHYVNDLEVNSKDGKTYILSNNTITVFSNETFEVLKTYPLGRIYALDFVTSNSYNLLTFFAEDTEGNQVLYSLDENTEQFNLGNTPNFPGEGNINHFQFNINKTHILITTDILEEYLYSFDTGKYIELKGDYLTLFENGDVLKVVYNKSENKATYSRVNPQNLSAVWSKTFLLKGVVGEAIPFRSDVSLNSNGKSLWIAPGTTNFIELSSKNGEKLGEIKKDGPKIAMLSYGKNLYAQVDYDTPYLKFKNYKNTPEISFGKKIRDITELVTYRGEDELEILFSSQYGNEMVSLLTNERVTKFTNYKTTFRDDYSNGKMIVDQKSKRVFCMTSNTDPIKVFERGKAKSFSNLIENYKGVEHFDYSPHTKILASISKAGIRVINTKEGTELFSKMIAADIPYFNHCLSLAPQKKSFAYVTNEIYGDGIHNDQLHYFNFESKKQEWVKEGRFYSVFHIEGGKKLIAANASKKQLEIIDLTNGNTLRTIPLEFGEKMLNSEITPDGKHILFSGYNLPGYLYEIETGKLVNTIQKSDLYFMNGTFVSNTIMAISSSGAIKFIDIFEGKEILRLYLFEDDNWIAYTPEGMFDGSPSAWSKVAFIKQNKAIPLESVFNNFYTPRLMHKVLVGKNFKSNSDLSNLKSPPSVTISFSEGTRNLVVEDDEFETEFETENGNGTISLKGISNDDTVETLHLYQNGKLINTQTRNLIVEDDVTQSNNEKKYNVTLVEGNNEFVAIAINSQNTESMPQSIRVHYTPNSQSLIKPQGIQAHVLIVGIDEYLNPKYNLNYAVADATGFQESLQKGLQEITSKTHVYFIKNKEAVRESIFKKFQEIAEVANPQDIFMFYYAGHGVMSIDEEEEFYIVPTDVTQLYGDSGALKQKGISAKELKQIAAGIPAQKQLYILDACQSAGALDAVASRGVAEEKAIAQLARSTGTHWLTASGSKQYATEFDELGHGVFTYALLEALSGKADSGDNRITVNELKAYLETRVPEISEKYKGSPQYPSSFGFGQDFPISVYK